MTAIAIRFKIEAPACFGPFFRQRPCPLQEIPMQTLSQFVAIPRALRRQRLIAPNSATSKMADYSAQTSKAAELAEFFATSKRSEPEPAMLSTCPNPRPDHEATAALRGLQFFVPRPV